ncbi:MAG: twin-arginine translocase TatA/TatE family subunit [Gaiellaceae bacterium]
MYTGLFSPWHIAILVLVILLVFGPKRLPEMGRSLGRGMREFKDSISGAPAGSEERALSASTGSPEPSFGAGERAARFCQACGGPLAQSAQFCSACGTAVEGSLVSGASKAET